jgi:hypothetical protein
MTRGAHPPPHSAADPGLPPPVIGEGLAEPTEPAAREDARAVAEVVANEHPARVSMRGPDQAARRSQVVQPMLGTNPVYHPDHLGTLASRSSWGSRRGRGGQRQGGRHQCDGEHQSAASHPASLSSAYGVSCRARAERAARRVTSRDGVNPICPSGVPPRLVPPLANRSCPDGDSAIRRESVHTARADPWPPRDTRSCADG